MKVFLKKLNLITTKDKYKYQQEQNYESISIIKYKGISFKKMNHEKDEQSFLWNLKSKIQEHFKNKSLKTHYFKDFSRTTYNSRTIQGIKGIQEPLTTLKYKSKRKICSLLGETVFIMESLIWFWILFHVFLVILIKAPLP